MWQWFRQRRERRRRQREWQQGLIHHISDGETSLKFARGVTPWEGLARLRDDEHIKTTS